MNFPNSQEVDESGQKKLVLHNIFLLCISILIGLLAYGQFVIALNSDVTPADNSLLHVDMMSFLQIIACSFCSPEVLLTLFHRSVQESICAESFRFFRKLRPPSFVAQFVGKPRANISPYRPRTRLISLIYNMYGLHDFEGSQVIFFSLFLGIFCLYWQSGNLLKR